MSVGIDVRNSNVRFHNVGVIGFDRGISSQDSRLHISNSQLNHNRIGLELTNSPSLVYQSDVSSNAIDVLAENSPIQMIDTVVQNIIFDGINQFIRTQPVSIHINPFHLRAQAQDILNTQNETSKKQKFKYLLKNLQKYGSYAAPLITILKAVYDYLASTGALGF